MNVLPILLERPFMPSLRHGLLGVVLLLPGVAAASPHIDVVTMDTGDHLTGEIKKLDRGQLRFKTEPTDTIFIDWEMVTHLTSPSHFQVELTNGKRYFGTLGEATEPGTLLIQGFDSALQIKLSRIVRITPIEDGFFNRVDGSLSVGYNFTKSSDVSQFNFNGDATYRERKFLVGLGVSSVITSQESGTTDRELATINYQRFYRQRWFTDWNGSGEKNEELGFDLRLLLSGAGGRHLIQNNHNLLDISGGLAVNREYLIDSSDTEDNIEALLALSYELFRYRSPEVKFSTGLKLFPSLTDIGRLRSELTLNFNWELFKDFFWAMDFYDSRDNNPATVDASTNDYGITTSVGWSF